MPSYFIRSRHPNFDNRQEEVITAENESAARVKFKLMHPGSVLLAITQVHDGSY